ncbi:15686_t:CDS:2 [Entrophospora sp. SA101]|nr:15686_t:CDS:2 [Entrophospora sp. SA101]
MLCMQAKNGDFHAINPQIINDKKFDEEYKKISKSIKGVPKDDFIDYYGYTYASRAEFLMSNEKINMNTATPEVFDAFGFKPTTSLHLFEECKKRPFNVIEDLKATKHQKMQIRCRYDGVLETMT